MLYGATGRPTLGRLAPPRATRHTESMISETERQRRADLARRRAPALKDWLGPCRVCPRECGADRLGGERGLCRTGDQVVVASFGPHFGEEAPLVGRGGSGAVFFAGCALRCCYCQNHEISQAQPAEAAGQKLEADELAMIFMAIQRRGCQNLNLVTPSHVVPQIVEALALAYDDGFGLPVVYNCSGYEQPETLAQLEGLVDIYLTDLKYGGPQQFSQAPGYAELAQAAVREMHRQVGDLVLGRAGLATRGLMVRHLVLPGGLADSAAVARFLATEISVETYVNVMGQYRPAWLAAQVEGLDRPAQAWEVEAAREAFWRAGLRRLETPPLDRGAAPRSRAHN